MIEITGVNLIELAKAAYDLSKPQGLGFLHHKEGSLTDYEAQSLISDDKRFPLLMDYVKGRSCKLTVWEMDEKLYIKDEWLDHSKDDLAQLIETIQSPAS